MASKLWEERFAGLLEAALMLRNTAITGITFFQALAVGAGMPRPAPMALHLMKQYGTAQWGQFLTLLQGLNPMYNLFCTIKLELPLSWIKKIYPI